MNESFPRHESSISFPVDYSSILERISQIDPVHYGKTRNFIDGAVTYLSPYISRGVISGKQVQDSVLAKGHLPLAIEKFLQELAWREYFQRVWQVKSEALFADMKQTQAEVIHQQMTSAVADASTGITAIDDQILELYKTGYMHNHVRMYVASISCNIGKAHWLAPSRWMYYHLLDGDLASNTCSWQWVAGTFSSKKYYGNQENINKYTRTHQSRSFLDMPVEQLPGAPLPGVLQSTVDLTLTTRLPKVPPPIVDATKPTLIYNSYNLDPLWRKEEEVNRVLLLEPSHFEKFPVSEKVLQWIIRLSGNIPHCQLMVGEVAELEAYYPHSALAQSVLVSKEHPAFDYYPGIKDPRDWMYPEVAGYFHSFFSYWKKCATFLQ